MSVFGLAIRLLVKYFDLRIRNRINGLNSAALPSLALIIVAFNFPANGGPLDKPSVGETMGILTGELVRNARAHTASKKDFEQKLLTARRLYFSLYPDQEGVVEAGNDLAELLYAKDLYYLGLYAPFGTTDKALQRNEAMGAMTGGVLDNGIPKKAWPSFEKWVNSFRKAMGARKKDEVILILGESRVTSALNTANREYEVYRSERDAQEFRSRGSSGRGRVTSTDKPKPQPSAMPEKVPQNEWLDFMAASAANTEVQGKAMATSEYIHMMLIASELFSASEENLRLLYKSRHMLERSIDKTFESKILDYSPWPRFFPPYAKLNEVPEAGFLKYREWTLSRIGGMGKQVTVPVPGCFVLDKDNSGRLLFSTATGYVATMPERTQFPNQTSWSSNSLAESVAERVGGMGRLVGVPAHSWFKLYTLMFVFPDDYKKYVVPVVGEVSGKVGECTVDTELDLLVTNISIKSESGGYALIYVEPKELRIYEGGQVVTQAQPVIH